MPQWASSLLLAAVFCHGSPQRSSYARHILTLPACVDATLDPDMT